VDDDTKQAIIDTEHLKLLRWGYFLSAGVTACFSMMGLVYAAMGAFITSIPVKEGEAAAAEAMAWGLAIVGITITVIMLALAAAKLRVAKALRELSATSSPSSRCWACPSAPSSA
jgi:Na+/melibiose symporter-like transporter